MSSSRLLYFPTAAPDELLYSLIARYARMSGGLPPREIMRQLFQSAQVAATWDLPSHIGSLAQALNVDPHSLIANHTLLPYYASALPAERVRVLQDWMLRGVGAAKLHVAIGSTASAVPTTRFLRFCPDCVRDDARDWGAAAWRRLHQCAGVVWCHIHQRPLWQSRVSLSAQRSHKHAATDLDQVAGRREGAPLAVLDPQLAERVATQSRELLRGRGPRGDSAWRLAHRQQCARVGWMTDHGSIRVARLRSALHGLVSPLWTDIGVRTDLDSDTHWLLGLLRSPRKAAHPLLHMLAEDFLARAAEEKPQAIRRSRPAASSQAESARTHVDRADWIALVQRLSGAGVARCRAEAPSLFARLYRSSRTWLREWNRDHVRRDRPKARQRVDWKAHEARLLPLLYSAHTKLSASSQRVTRAALMRELAREGFYQGQLSKLPRVREALEIYSETASAFLDRRLRRAVPIWFEAHDRWPRNWEILRAANVRWPWGPTVHAAAGAAIARYAGAISAMRTNRSAREPNANQRMAAA